MIGLEQQKDEKAKEQTFRKSIIEKVCSLEFAI